VEEAIDRKQERQEYWVDISDWLSEAHEMYPEMVWVP